MHRCSVWAYGPGRPTFPLFQVNNESLIATLNVGNFKSSANSSRNCL